MAGKKKTVELSQKEIGPWLSSKMGEMGIQEFATSIGVKRSVVSNIINGRTGPGPKLRRALARHGMVGARTVYIVEAPAE